MKSFPTFLKILRVFSLQVLKVAELKVIKLWTSILSAKTKYGICLIMKISDGALGLSSVPVEISLEIGNRKEVHMVFLDHRNSERELLPERLPCKRGDGWMEIELGELFNGGYDDDDEEEVREFKGDGERKELAHSLRLRESEPNSWEDVMKDELEREKYPRMPWHDVHCALWGPPCRDVARHFVQRWNHAKRSKAPNEQTIPLLMPQHHMEADCDEEVSFGDEKLTGLVSSLLLKFDLFAVSMLSLGLTIFFSDDIYHLDLQSQMKTHQLDNWWDTQERVAEVVSTDEIEDVGPRTHCHCQFLWQIFCHRSAGTTQTELIVLLLGKQNILCSLRYALSTIDCQSFVFIEPPSAEKGKAKVSCEDLGEGQFNDFSTYHLQTSDSELDFDWTDSDGDSLYDDEIPSRSVDIDASFEDICKNKGVRYEGKLGGDDPYSDSSDSGSDISDEEEGDPVDDDEVVDPLSRTFSSKIYFDKTAKKVCFQLYMVFFNAIEFREALQSYSIQKGVNLKLKPNEKERVKAKCKHKGCPWVILGSIDNTEFFTVKTYFSVHKYSKRTRNKMCNPLWICKHYKDRNMSDPSIKLHQIQALLRKDYGLLYDYAEQLRTTNPGTTVSIRTSKNAIPEKEVFMGIYICLGALKSGWIEGCKRIIGLDGAFLKGGLHLALTNLLSNAEHKWCARHIWANWKQNTDVSPMAMEVLTENAEYAAKCEVRFNRNMGFDIGDPPYTHVVNVKRNQCSCRSWQLKGIPCAHAIAAMHYNGWNVESYVDH
ncbi:hypothetical protein T459_33696 [Capsicum annuum]|uniref:SWIM-type domain-containing protein n=1 Tax=Capsicum annuum TaxID=4072 RepID=A0A2G2XYG3_CAPAN|nr:hypothetical protein FXO37_23057 [Capsicum annuum]PHT62479.1 hypothetical protein T459_33696 [Capsicum annuum]